MSSNEHDEKGEMRKDLKELTKEKQIQIAVTRAKEQGLDISESDLMECWLSSSEDDNESEGETPSKRGETGKGTWYQKMRRRSGDHCDDNNARCDSNVMVGSSRVVQENRNDGNHICGGEKRSGTPWSKLCSKDYQPKRRKRKPKYVWETKEKKAGGGKKLN